MCRILIPCPTVSLGLAPRACSEGPCGEQQGHRTQSTAGVYVQLRTYHFSLCNLERVSRPSQPWFPVCKVEETLLSALQSHSEGSLRSKQWLLQEASSLRVWGGNVKVRTWGLKQRYRGRQDDFVEPVPGSPEISGHKECRTRDKGFRQGWRHSPQAPLVPDEMPLLSCSWRIYSALKGHYD